MSVYPRYVPVGNNDKLVEGRAFFPFKELDSSLKEKVEDGVSSPCLMPSGSDSYMFYSSPVLTLMKN